MVRSLLSKHSRPALVAVVAGFSLVGCPDPEASFDEFMTRRAVDAAAATGGQPAPGGAAGGEAGGGAGGGGGASGAGGAGGAGAMGCEAAWDVSGQYLFSLSTFIRADRPMVFGAQVVFTPAAAPTDDDAGTVELTLQPLYCKAANPDPECTRENVGPPLPKFTFKAGKDGKFRADLGQLTVAGDANPITGRDITATLILVGSLRDKEICGGVEGEVTSPIMSPLTPEDSRFGTTWVGELGEDVGAALKAAEIRYDCGACQH
jgi:hypothetical protein